MRTLLVIALICALGAAGLGYAWHVLGEVREARPAAPGASDGARTRDEDATNALERVEARGAPVAVEVDASPAPLAPDGFEDGGAAPLVRDYAAIYAERTTAERRVAAERLRGEIEAARAALGPAEFDELAGRRGNQATTPGVARLLALIEERTWLLASLAGEPDPARKGDP